MSYDFYVGADPGFEGAIALLSAKGEILNCWDFPWYYETFLSNRGVGKKRKKVDIAQLNALMAKLGSQSVLMGVEELYTHGARLNADSKGGGSGDTPVTAWQLSSTVSALEVAAHCNGIRLFPSHLLRPMCWKKDKRYQLWGAGDQAKTMAIAHVKKMFPKTWPSICPEHKSRPGTFNQPKADRAEAVLIADYMRRIDQSQEAAA